VKRTADAVIIGGGCMGASVAFHLARRGMSDVVLVEREPLLGTGSTGRNAGGVRHQFSHEANVRLSIESIRMFERFEEEVGHPIDFHQDGYLFLLTTAKSVAAFRRNVELQRRLGVPVQWLDPHESAALAPGLSVEGVEAATYCARDGIADPNGVTMGFARAAQDSGVEVCRSTEVVGIHTDNQGIAGVETTFGRISTRTVVNATGPHAKQIGEMVGINIPVLPYRRHIFIAQAAQPGVWYFAGAEIPATRILVIDFETTFYFHREGAGVLFGMAAPDEAVGFDTTVRWDFLHHVTEVAVRRLPALQNALISKAWAGLYEMTPDAMPVIGPVRGLEGFFLINGFSGHGFQHCPAAGRILADLITTKDPQFDVKPFAFERFDRAGIQAECNVV
jgi:sarcosine oxidase subunit beta